MSFRMQDLSIRGKLVAMFAALMLMFSVLGGTAINRFSAMEANATSLATNYTLALGYLGDMREAVMAYRAHFLRALVVRDSTPGATERLDAAAAAILARLQQAEEKYAPTVATAEERQIYDRFRDKWNQFRTGVAPLRELIAKGQYDEGARLVRALAALGGEIDAALQQDAKFNEDIATGLADQMVAGNRWGFWGVLSMMTASLALAVLAGWMLVRSIGVPVRQMTGAMHRLAAHDLTTEIAGADRGDEIGAMAKAVQVFKDGMIKADRVAADSSAAQAAKEQRAAKLDALVHEFEAKVAGLVQTLAAASAQMESTARSMAATAVRTSERTDKVGSSAQAATAGAQTVASAAEQLSASIGEISRQVDKSSKITGEAVAAAQRTDAIVHALAQGAQKIGDVVDLITSIAGQTNLLALNATIEAARVGDAGKGFAVVASEVKSLANQTAKATEDISAQINQIQTATKEAVAAIRDITETIAQVSGIATSIASAMEEQGSATAEIARSVQETAANTVAVQGHIAEVSQAATDTGTAAEEVLRSAGQLSHQADDLSRAVGGFVEGVRAA